MTALPLLFVVVAATLQAGLPATTMAQPLSGLSGQEPAATDIAPVTRRVALADLGFTRDVLLEGTNAAATLTFPLPVGGIDAGTLTLIFSASPELDDRSIVLVTIDGADPARTTVGALRQQPTWVLPIAGTDASDVSVRVAAMPQAGSNRCADVSAGILWMRLGRDSGLSFVPRPATGTLAEFLRFPGGTIGVRTTWDTRESQAAGMAVHAALSHLLRDLPVRTAVLPDDMPLSTPSFEDRPLRIVDISPARAGLPARRVDDVLQLSGENMSIVELEAAAASAHSPRPIAAECGPNRLCFEALGQGDQRVAGIGTLRASTYFTLADLGGWPDGLEVNLDLRIDEPVPTGGSLVRVSLNGSALETFPLDGQTALQHTTRLPSPLVNVSNTLDIEFVHMPAEADCDVSSTTELRAQILRSSAFSWTGIGASHHRLAEIVAAGGTVALHLGEDSARLARTAAYVIGAIARQSRQPLYLSLAGGANSEAWDFYVGQVPDRVLPVRLPLTRRAEVMARRSITPVVAVSPDSPALALEYLDLDRPALSLQATAAAGPAQLAAAFVDVFEDARFLGLPGDLFVTAGPHTLALDLASGALAVRDAASRDWSARARLSIFSASSVCIVGALMLVYRRLGQPPSAPPAPAD